jgi:hypothetical protein
MTEQEQNDYVAAKMGIIYLCENCHQRIHSMTDKTGWVIGWIHDSSETVLCNSKTNTQAFPASLDTLEQLFNPKPRRIKQTYKLEDSDIEFARDDWWLNTYE